MTPEEQAAARTTINDISTFLTETEATDITMSDVKDMFTDTMRILTYLVG